MENNEGQQAVQQANTEALTKTDSFEAGLQQAVKIEGVADKEQKVYGEKSDPLPVQVEAPKVEAPVAAPIQQIAPVSANGEQTSARESPKADAPDNVQVTQPSGENVNPSDVNSRPSVPPEAANTEEVAPEVEVPFEELPPLEQANHLLNQIPGRFRLY
jgi:hypothetical protein